MALRDRGVSVEGPLSSPGASGLYAQLAEAGGVYESLLNTMQVAQLKAYNLWPFQDLVRVRQLFGGA